MTALAFPPRFPGFASRLRSRGAFGVASHCRLSFWTLDQFQCGNAVLSAQDSNTAPQTSQDTWPLCGIKHVGSMRLFSAPHSHQTSVASILENARGRGKGPGGGEATRGRDLPCSSNALRPAAFLCQGRARGQRSTSVRGHEPHPLQ